LLFGICEFGSAESFFEGDGRVSRGFGLRSTAIGALAASGGFGSFGHLGFVQDRFCEFSTMGDEEASKLDKEVLQI
jgi:hypothetical protein